MAMVLSLFTGCSGAQTPEATQAAEATTAQSEPPSDTAAAPEEPVFPLPEKVTLSGFGCSYPGQVAWETMPLFEELENAPISTSTGSIWSRAPRPLSGST